MPMKKEFSFLSADGSTQVYAVAWIPDAKPHAVLQLIHGLDEHVGRYAPFAEFMAEHGYVVVGNDHLGHGRTAAAEEDFGFFAEKGGWDLVLSDIHALREQTGKEWPDLPYFMLGHSMGSFLLRSYIIRWPGDIFGAVISGTGQMARPVVAAGRALARTEIRLHGPKVRSMKLYNLSFGAYNKRFQPIRTERDWLTRDTEIVDANIADPFCGHVFTASLFRDMLGGIAYNRKPKNLRRMDRHLRVLFIAGDSDPVGDFGRGVTASYNSFVKTGMRHVRMRLFKDCRHEVLNELNRGEIWGFVLGWAEHRMEKKFGVREELR